MGAVNYGSDLDDGLKGMVPPGIGAAIGIGPRGFAGNYGAGIGRVRMTFGRGGATFAV
jgi:hypothetical protein